jgi:hypothetical protein
VSRAAVRPERTTVPPGDGDANVVELDAFRDL